MEFDAATPIWMQVATCIKTDIVSQKLMPGAKLPGGRELALRYTINPNTAARVYQMLQNVKMRIRGNKNEKDEKNS